MADKKVDLNDPKYQGAQFRGKTYFKEPTAMEKAKIVAKDAAKKAASDVYDTMADVTSFAGKTQLQRDKEKQESIPSDIADQLQTSKNERAAAAYEKRRAAGDDYKKGGSVKSCKCMARGGGCEVRGKTKGRFV